MNQSHSRLKLRQRMTYREQPRDTSTATLASSRKGYPPSVSKFTRALRMGTPKGTVFCLESVQLDDHNATVNYAWTVAPSISVVSTEEHIRAIVDHTLAQSDWGDSAEVLTVTLSAETTVACAGSGHFAVYIRLGSGVKLKYAIKACVLLLFMFGAFWTVLVALHFLWHIAETLLP